MLQLDVRGEWRYDVAIPEKNVTPYGQLLTAVAAFPIG